MRPHFTSKFRKALRFGRDCTVLANLISTGCFVFLFVLFIFSFEARAYYEAQVLPSLPRALHHKMATADFNGDGWADIVVLGVEESSSVLAVHLNIGNGKLGPG